MYACLAVTCHLHFWQNDRDFLRATVVTRGWNGYRNKSQHRKSTLEKKILPPFQQGFEPATFQSRVPRRSNHWAIPAPGHHTSLSLAYKLANSYPLLVCLIRAAILNFFSVFVCICLHPDTLSSVVLIRNLLYQSAGIVLVDGGRVSEGLVMVSLAFHLFVIGTVSFASVLLCQVKNIFIPSKENVVPHIKPQLEDSVHVKE